MFTGQKYRTIFLLIASYYFYMNWKPIYAVLILTSTLLTYFSGILVEKNANNKTKKKFFLSTSIILNFAILFIFKYYNFITESIICVLSEFGLHWNVPNLDVLLPVGISFYTFQAVGYSIDVYRGTIKAEKNFFTYALFVSFFPQLVAGPIERAKNLLPQFHMKHKLDYNKVTEGFKQMIWGYFMKLCIADRISEYVDTVYNNVDSHNGTTMILATFFFTFQIYCDFAGYSNIAIGSAKIMGFNLMENFHRPYFSLSIKEFWKRWHISLSTWFMDYVYIPLGGNRVRYSRHLFNLMVTFVVSGIWHGANWTFVLWGALHGTYLISENIIRKHIHNSKQTSGLSKFFSTVISFILVSFAWIFFRANNVNDAFVIIEKIFTNSGSLFINKSVFLFGVSSLIIAVIKELKDEFDIKLNFMHSKYIVIRYLSVTAMISFILLMAAFNGGQFIYFQF